MKAVEKGKNQSNLLAKELARKGKRRPQSSTDQSINLSKDDEKSEEMLNSNKKNVKDYLTSLNVDSDEEDSRPRLISISSDGEREIEYKK